MSLKVTVEGDLKPLTLTDNDFVHAGGEGSVYIQGSTAFKIYHDRAKMIELARLQELQSITCDNVIKPEKILYNLQGHAIGYTMKALNDVWALTRLFNKSFRTKHGITSKMVSDLVQRARDTYASLHQQGFLVADGNELNFLVSDDFKEIYFIDVDAFKTPSFACRAYNENTLDPIIADSLDFTKESDWYAYAVIAFQLLVGLHPFKGIYEGTEHAFTRKDIVARMKKRVSCFHSDVRLSRPLIQIDEIPTNYFDWLKSMFETDRRTMPPEMIGGLSVAKTIVANVVSSVLKISEVGSYSNEIVDVYSNGRVYAVKTKTHFDIQGVLHEYYEPSTELVFLPKTNTPVQVRRDGQSIAVRNMETKTVNKVDYGLRELFVFENLVYGVGINGIIEFEFRESPTGITILGETIEMIIPGSVKVYDAVIVESLLGGTHISVLPESGQCAKFHLKEFDNKRIVNAKYQNKILAVVWYDQGSYTKSFYKLSSNYRDLKMIREESVDSPEFNMAVLDQGICIVATEQNELVLFSNRSGQDDIKVLSNQVIPDDMRLFKLGSKLHGMQQNKLLSLSMS